MCSSDLSTGYVSGYANADGRSITFTLTNAVGTDAVFSLGARVAPLATYFDPDNYSPVTPWVTEGDFGAIYEIETYMNYYAVPAPGAIAVLGMAGLMGRRRR